MLSPVDTTKVFQPGRVAGRTGEEIHPGVAWWVAACFVVATGSRRMLLASDGHPVTADFCQRFGQGAINARHYACQVLAVADTSETQLVDAIRQTGVPGAWLATAEDGVTVQITLYQADGSPLDAKAWEQIRQMIDQDRVPIPVNTQAKGTVMPIALDALTQEARS
ncbi:hypothetical protein [Streptacidiphilus sp. EB129]|uniref:hypothetical protein n=1 Tax=Streptacidiphilus sp. EB129 TaxID=3156262 RepID=UPI003514B5DC